MIGGKLMYIKSGTTGHTFKGISIPETEKSVNYGLKIVAYPKKDNYGTIYDSKYDTINGTIYCIICGAIYGAMYGTIYGSVIWFYI